MGIALAVVSHKGGAGKTATAVNLAGAFAASHLRTVLIDADPQGAAGAALKTVVGKPSLYEVISGANAMTAVTKTGIDMLDILPADLDLAGAEVELPRMPAWQGKVSAALQPVIEAYDMVVVDTAPGLGILPYAALIACTGAIVTCPPDFLSFRAVPQVLATIARAAQTARSLRTIGIVPTFASRRSRVEREVLETLAEDYGELLLPEIPRRIVLQEATLAGMPITEYAPSSDIALAFSGLAQEVLRRAKQAPIAS